MHLLVPSRVLTNSTPSTHTTMSVPPAHLITVCCHGIWLGGSSRGCSESEWLIADFQRGETTTFIEHIKAGVRALAQDPEGSVLVFSGGPTRKETELSEAQSYANIAAENNHWDLLPDGIASDQILIEDRALDSYHNVLFSLTLFYSRFHTWPSQITIVSHAFKKERLIDGHCAAIGFPLDRVNFIGIDPPGMTAAVNGVRVGDGKEEALKGVGLAMGEWREDPHGRGESLAGKRRKRNPWNIKQSVFVEDGDTGGLVIVGEVLDEQAPRPW